MKKLLILASLLLLTNLPAHAQFSRIIGITGTQNTNAQDFYAASPFTIKAGANCTWSSVGTVHTFNCAAGAGGVTTLNGLTGAITLAAGTNISLVPVGNTITINNTAAATVPGGANLTFQYNNGGAFGGTTGLTNGLAANCDGMGSTCYLNFAVPTGPTPPALFTAVDAGAPAGSYNTCYTSVLATFECDATNGTSGGSLIVGSATAVLFSQNTAGTNATGINADPDDRVVGVGRLRFDQTYVPTLVAGNFVPSAGWGSTATVSSTGGSDNNFLVEVTSGGAGIAANPTITFTYAGGDFDTAGASTPPFTCTQTGGSDIISDVTVTRGQTSMTMNWFGTPTTAKTYEISCIGIQR